MTASVTVSPMNASASAFSFCRIMALISGGLNSLPSAWMRASPFGPWTTSYGTIFISSSTSPNLRPMNRLTENTVFSGLVTAWRLATVPTRRSPVLENATTDGVVRPPSEFGMTSGSPPVRTAMQELVVPRSIPIVFAMRCVASWTGPSGGPPMPIDQPTMIDLSQFISSLYWKDLSNGNSDFSAQSDPARHTPSRRP